MNRKVRIVQIGYGKMGRRIVSYMIESGADVIGVFDANPAIIGDPVPGLEKTVTIEPVDMLEQEMARLRPDCAIVATKSLMRDVKDTILACTKYGVNVVTTCDEALYPWTSSPAITREIDLDAKVHACTVSSSGFPDLAYCSMIAAVCGAAHRITAITGTASYNVDDYGIALAEHHGVGLSAEEFQKTIGALNDITPEEQEKMINDGKFTAIPMWNANCWLCAKLGLTILSHRQFNLPIFAEKDVYSSTMGRVIRKGETLGMTAKAIAETKEGIRLETESIGKVYEEGEEDTNDWMVHGDPDIRVSNLDIHNEEMICSLVVSRIVNTLNAPSGFVTSDHFPPATFLLNPINCYIRDMD